MAAFKGIADMFTQMSKDLRYAAEKTSDQVADIMVEGGELQLKLFRQYIEQRPRPWSGRYGGQTHGGAYGRYHTGQMFKSVDAEIVRSKTTIRVKVGYIGMNPEVKYYLMQDEGFYHKTAQRFIPGTMAKVDSYLQAREYIIREFAKIGLRSTAFAPKSR